MWFGSGIAVAAVQASAAAPIQLLAQEFPYAAGAAVKKNKTKKKKKTKNSSCCILGNSCIKPQNLPVDAI